MTPVFDSAGDFFRHADNYRQPQHGQQWGNWRLNAKNLTLEHSNGGYYVDLERLTTSAQMLDDIFQIRGKVWASNEDLGNLLSALDELIDPQGNLCSIGQGSRFDVSQHLRSIKDSAPPEAGDDEENAENQ